MANRKKSKFEKWFSFSRHKRRFGAKTLSSRIDTDFTTQKNTVIKGDKIVYTHGSRNDLEQHFDALKNEFIGKSELCYTHAKLIVLIRREFEAEKHFLLFEQLWQEEEKHLLKHLNTRWLIAATDTFCDYSKDEAIRATSLAASLLINTIKIVETERHITNAKDNQNDSQLINNLQKSRFALFDGTSAFAVGTDDTLRNMRWRINALAKNNIAGKILLTIFLRVQDYDTIYCRIKRLHTREKTAWWV